MTASPSMAEPAAHRPMVDLNALATSCPPVGPGWTHQSDDLNVNLLIFARGDGIPAHVNAEVDVLVVGIQGCGSVEIDGQRYACGEGQAIVIPKGSRRAILAESACFAYLTCHRRRAGLWPTVRAAPSR